MTTMTGSRPARQANNFKVVRDTAAYRQVSFEDEADPAAAALRRAQRRFRSNVQLETGRFISLSCIRVAYIPANPQQLVQAWTTLGELPAGKEVELKLILPYAVSGGRVYLLLDTFESLDSEQTRAFLTQELHPHIAALGLRARNLERVLVPNRQR